MRALMDAGPSLDVLVGTVILVLDEVVEQRWPSLRIVIQTQVVAYGLQEVEKHVPRVPGDPAHTLHLEERQPAAEKRLVGSPGED